MVHPSPAHPLHSGRVPRGRLGRLSAPSPAHPMHSERVPRGGTGRSGPPSLPCTMGVCRAVARRRDGPLPHPPCTVSIYRVVAGGEGLPAQWACSARLLGQMDQLPRCRRWQAARRRSVPSATAASSQRPAAPSGDSYRRRPQPRPSLNRDRAAASTTQLVRRRTHPQTGPRSASSSRLVY